jgi:carboxyl-terminal processing protease
MVLRLFLVLTVSILSFSAYSQAAKNFQQEVFLLKKTIEANHYSPRLIDDSFSKWVYDDLLNTLDPDKLYFIASEVQKIEAFKATIDNEITKSVWTFVPLLTQIFKNGLERSVVSIEQHTQKPFVFTLNESSSSDTIWAGTEKENNNRWRLALKVEMLDVLTDLRETEPTLSDQQFLLIHEPEARERIKLRKLSAIKRILNDPKGLEYYVASALLKSIASAFDPHTTYFTPTELENFMAALNTEGYYFGVSLGENKLGEITISRLTPGGPAWKAGTIHAGDVIINMQWEGGRLIDLTGVSMEEVSAMLSSENHNLLTVTLRDASGLHKSVRIRKERMEAEENRVRSFILTGKNKIGYIALPGFYSDFGGTEGANCANDVAKEIIKLKKEGIEGLILDLRYNGGGSLDEAVAMAGIFIDAGPIGLLRSRDGAILSVKDMYRGTVFDGPLVVMVNGMSASASEFLTASLQDYHRAIIVGGHTYGKATAQNIFPLNPKNAMGSFLDNISKSNFGFVSVTIEKIYRITGKTAQQNGVIPDIVLPDAITYLAYRESYLPLALPSDSVQKKTYYQPLAGLPIEELQSKSEKRVAQKSSFSTVEQYGLLVNQTVNCSDPEPLAWVAFKKKKSKTKAMLNLVLTDNDTSAFVVSSHDFDQQRIKMDEYIDVINQVWIKNLGSDISLQEAFHIICDYIQIKTRK